MGIVGAFMVPHPPMIIPEIGRGGETVIEETARAYERVAETVAELAPEVIVISSPHSVMYSDYFHISPGRLASGSFAAFGAPQIRFEAEYDDTLALRIAADAAAAGIDAGVLGEKDASLDHGTMVPLYFLTQKYTGFKLVRLSLSGLSLPLHYRYGMQIQRAAEELSRRVVFLASGDLSHKLRPDGPYGLDPAGPVYDERIMEVMGSGRFDRLLDFEESFLDKAAECGHRSFVMMAGALDRTAVRIGRLSHQDVTGVGYGICTYVVTKAPGDAAERSFLEQWEERNRNRLKTQKDAEDAYVRLARRSLESYIRGQGRIRWEEVRGEILAPERRDPAQERVIREHLSHARAGTFVSLHKDGRLRGCIGTIAATQDCIAEEIIENAISASTRDPRFSPVTEEELDALEYSVDVLGETEPIRSEAELDVKRYGVIVTKGMRRGLLLPNLEGIDTVEEQVAIAKQKAGLAADERGCALERFEVVRHSFQMPRDVLF